MRCTCNSQNLAFAPRTEYCASNPRFQGGYAHVFFAICFGFKMNVPIFCRGDLTTCGASRFARKCMPITIRNGYAPYGIPTAAGRGRRHRRPEKTYDFAKRYGYRLSLFMFFLSIRKERTKESASFLRGGNTLPREYETSRSVIG